MAVIQFKFDESYNNEIMCVGGWIGEEAEWQKLEAAWSNRIAKINSVSRNDQKITRFHATEMNCKSGEYHNWTPEMCGLLTSRLISAIAKRRMGAIGVACDMRAVHSVFPAGDAETMKRRMYVLCIKQLMVDIAHKMIEFFPGDQVLLVHESGSWNVEARQAYELMVDEQKGWGKGSVFCGFTCLSKIQSVGLEACDLFAYEVFKGVKAQTVDPNIEDRKAVAAMKRKEIAMTARWINKKGAEALYAVMKESGKYPDLDTKGLT